MIELATKKASAKFSKSDKELLSWLELSHVEVFYFLVDVVDSWNNEEPFLKWLELVKDTKGRLEKKTRRQGAILMVQEVKEFSGHTILDNLLDDPPTYGEVVKKVHGIGAAYDIMKFSRMTY